MSEVIDHAFSYSWSTTKTHLQKHQRTNLFLTVNAACEHNPPCDANKLVVDTIEWINLWIGKDKT